MRPYIRLHRATVAIESWPVEYSGGLADPGMGGPGAPPPPPLTKNRDWRTPERSSHNTQIHAHKHTRIQREREGGIHTDTQMHNRNETKR